jgi:hypothetical protein
MRLQQPLPLCAYSSRYPYAPTAAAAPMRLQQPLPLCAYSSRCPYSRYPHSSS